MHESGQEFKIHGVGVSDQSLYKEVMRTGRHLPERAGKEILLLLLTMDTAAT